MEDKETKQFIGKAKERENRIELKIEKLGIKNQVDELMKAGFEKKDAVKALKKNDKNLEKSLTYLKEGQGKRLKKKEILEKIETLGLKEQIDILLQLGLRLKKAYRELESNNFDANKAKESLLGKGLKQRDNKYFQKCREECKIEKYKQLFPNDENYDWAKFKEEKKKLRLAKKLESLEIKQCKDLKKEERQKCIQEEIQEGIHTVYVDGNNLFCVDSRIRKLFIRHKIKKAEEKIFLLTFNYFKLMKVPQVILVFDNAKNCFVKESDGLKLVVCSANPNFKTSDDALVVWSGGISASDKDKVLFVTSDRGLMDRLIEKGITKIMKSGRFIDIAKSKIGQELFDSFFEKEEKKEEEKEGKPNK